MGCVWVGSAINVGVRLPPRRTYELIFVGCDTRLCTGGLVQPTLILYVWGWFSRVFTGGMAHSTMFLLFMRFSHSNCSAIRTVICPTLGLVQSTMHHHCLALLSLVLRVCSLCSRLYTRCLHETTEYVFRITPSVDMRWIICVADVPEWDTVPCADMVDHMGVKTIAGLYSTEHHLTDLQQRMVNDRLVYSDVA